MCKKHNKPIDIICLTDLMPVCSMCALFTGHKNHKLVPKQEMRQSKLNELSEDDYYLYVFPEQEKNKIKEMFKQKNAVNLKDKQNIILNQLARHNIYEHSNWMRERISRLKDTLL